ncbi:MAG TPA: outer membrane beta-barrel protein [Usitatibacteraceae bacterium]
MKKTILSLGILAAIASTQVFAADTNLYVRGNVGPSSYDVGGGYGTQNDVMVGVALGYTFSPNLAAEVGFNDYGKINFGGVDGTAKTTHASLILTAPLNNQFSIYGRAGVASTEDKVSDRFGSFKETKTEGLFGVGVGYNFARNLIGTIEYQRLNDSDVSAFVAGVKFSF